MKKAVFIIPYFGEVPIYVEAWYKSALLNDSFNFLIISDNEEFKKYECNNITVNISTFEDFKQRIQNKFEFDICLNKPYKLCDYKPVYGRVLKDEISDYEYWGFCDMDMIFGNLSTFLDKYIANKCLKIGKNGHMSLFRNNDDVNNLFMSKKGPLYYKDVFQNDMIFGFDEMQGLDVIFKNEGIESKKIILGDVSPVYSEYKNIHSSNRYQICTFKNGKCYFGLKNKKEETALWQEVAYIHFQKKTPSVPKNLNIMKTFYLNSSGIVLESIDREKHFYDFKDFNSRFEKCRYLIYKIIHYITGNPKRILFRIKANKYL